MRQFKIKWATSECSVDAEKAQSKAMKALSKQLKQDGFELSHMDDEGFAVYLPTGKPARPRKKVSKKRTIRWAMTDEQRKAAA